MPLRTCLDCPRLTPGTRCPEHEQARLATGHVSAELRARVFATRGRRCTYCGRPADAIDHDVPVARGGLSILPNLLPACRRDNRAKGSMTGTEYRAHLARQRRDASPLRG